MKGCANAKEVSGSYPFVQKNEFSINISDYFNEAKVKAAIPDGTLCHANDPRKVGMSAINDPSAWSRTDLAPGTFTYTFNATAPHNPSFWKFYITKQGTDLRQPLKWTDLELIKEDNDSTVNSQYSTSLTIPADRSGNHILFVRWQRIDAVGEGFYNCSDITVVNEDSPVNNDPIPPLDAEPDLMQGAQYVVPEYNVGDNLVFEVISSNDQIQKSFNIDVTSANAQFIPELLAAEVNGFFEKFHDGDVFIGAWHNEMNHYMYFNNGNPNYFNSEESSLSFKIRVNESASKPISLVLKELLTSDNIIEHGSYASVSIQGSFANYEIEELSNTGVELSLAASHAFIGTQGIDKNLLPTEVTLRVTTNLNEIDSQQKNISFTVVENEDYTSTPTDDILMWDASKTYVGGDSVKFNNRTWVAKWWVRAGDNPELIYSRNVWGVWRPIP
jgi:predicted carbohydrate-binding protein with CBM5 and CBM33 domain